MKSHLARLLLLPPLAALLMAAGPADWRPYMSPAIVLAAGSCSHADDVAQDHGGRVIGSPRLVNEGGQQKCVVTILITPPPGPDGKAQPPVRRDITFEPR